MDEPADPTSPPPAWSLAKRVLFRFTFAYFLLYLLPFPLDVIPYVDRIGEPYQNLWNRFIPWVGQRFLGLKITVFPNGSGDTTNNYVQVLCFLVFALAATLAWSFLDRRRPHYARLAEWFRVYLRFALGVVLISYGSVKVIKSQFPYPSADRLLQPFGDASPMGLLWTFMGASRGYNIFSGACEMLGGLLLIARRTTLLGALFSTAVLVNIVALNFCYDVPVKLYSCHLLAMALVLAAPDLRRLANLFLFNRRVEPAVLAPLFKRAWQHRGALILRTVFLLGYTAFALHGAYQGVQTYGELAPKPPLYGIWDVEEIEVDGKPRPALVTDATRWRRVIFAYQGSIAIQLMDGSRRRYSLKLDPVKKTLELAKRDDPKNTFTLSYKRPAPGLLTLEGTLEKQQIRAQLRRTDPTASLLMSRGFHWINEYPFNR